MIRWQPETCYCSIITQRPSVNGKFETRCRLHATTRNTIDVYQHNIANKLKDPQDMTTNANKKLREEKPAARKRVDDLKESTRR